MQQPYRESQTTTTPTHIDGKEVRSTTYEFDVIEAMFYWHDPTSPQAKVTTKTYTGGAEPTPDWHDGVCVQMFKHSPYIDSGDTELAEHLDAASKHGLLYIDADTIIPWHRVIKVSVVKRTPRSFTVKWVPYEWGK